MAWDETGKIWMDGKFVEWKDANTHVLSHVIHYGSSVFEGIRCYENNGKPAIFKLKQHVKRLFESAKIYKMEIPYSQKDIEEAIKETISINKLKECYIRPVSYRGYGSLGVNPTSSPVNTAISVWGWGSYLGEEALEKGVDVGVSSWRRMAPNTLPSMSKSGANYMNAQLAKLEAIENNYDECIMLDTEGFIGEGSGENIFLIKDDVIYTPSLSSAILKGITRDSIMELITTFDYELREEKLPREMLYLADELFFTGTAAEVSPIRSVDGIQIGNGKRGHITEEIQSKFFSIVEGKTEDTFNWLTYLE
ncbi:branched-chain-amino-acid aminotransferase [Methanobrevibacter cuticularis]|uniref:Branched-chain-amino-acid aminotransferase n=1 Tax=Methanobrevibacter cuticularis TaxID=47311 RepID=A0A166D2T0_9EURY|nr:branched-chain amino acid transaminase [Methanobrevibacter cuticularis]KZX15150.1 branched-chain-amino-acid aminotransferase [Methanobrevibacter cuticularis]